MSAELQPLLSPLLLLPAAAAQQYRADACGGAQYVCSESYCNLFEYCWCQNGCSGVHASCMPNACDPAGIPTYAYYAIGAGVAAVLAVLALTAWRCCCPDCCCAKSRPTRALQLGYMPLLATAGAPAAVALAAPPAALAAPAAPGAGRAAVPARPAAAAVEDPAAIAPRYCAACGAKTAGGAFCASCGRAYAPA